MRRVQRYLLHDELASGGMGSIHLAKLPSEGGFSKVVAIKVMHAQYARNEAFRAMFLDEARIVAGIRHTNVVSTLDILEEAGELFLVMDYVHGPSLSSVVDSLHRESEVVPADIVATVIVDVLEGLHAAHEAKSDRGAPLGIVHRDVSPHNVLLASDGTSRVVDFGVALAADRLHLTNPGEVKGKASYMSPEQAQGGTVDRRSDVYAVGVMMFELLTGQRPFVGKMADVMLKQITMPPPRPSALRSSVPPELERILLKAMEKEPDARFESARVMANAIRTEASLRPKNEVADWVLAQQRRFFEQRDALLLTLQAIDTDPGKGHVEVSSEGDKTERNVAATSKGRRGVYIAAGLFVLGSGAWLARSYLRSPSPAGPTGPSTVASNPSPPIALTPTSALAASAPESRPTETLPTAIRSVPSIRPVRAPLATAAPSKPLESCCPHGLRKAFTNCSEVGCPP